MRHHTQLASGAASAPRWSHSDQPERASVRFGCTNNGRAHNGQPDASAFRLISDRRGLSLVIVMIAISMSMVLTYAAPVRKLAACKCGRTSIGGRWLVKRRSRGRPSR